MPTSAQGRPMGDDDPRHAVEIMREKLAKVHPCAERDQAEKLLAQLEARWSSGGDWRAALAQLIPLLAGLQEALAGGRRRRRRARSAARAAGGGSPPGRGRGERRLLWARFPPAGRSSSSQP
ncbi:unnamed protein product [Prorocentrum cordatum]|uniref:Uncharacterized protein n=1 Tax=Prorocentrum cordatum TaxID=2364126 RepID=A0ABN9Q6K1_9DINO|nr:unnamed protein product [Polarella glacialis]